VNGGRPPDSSPFDAYAASYDDDLARGLAVSGEDKGYYALGRIRWLGRRLAGMGERAPMRRVLDFGCGDGASVPLLRGWPGTEQVLGVDVSAGLLAVARSRNAGPGIAFAAIDDAPPRGDFDLAFTNGVFHHIPPGERGAALEYVRGALRPGGWFAFWENNPWNPGTRYIMSRVAFDRDAMTIPPPAGRRMLQQAGFAVRAVDTLFYFPRWLGWLRALEPALARLPLGGQYLVLAQRP
jgi:SAM-dependent methyltransferase